MSVPQEELAKANQSTHTAAQAAVTTPSAGGGHPVNPGDATSTTDTKSAPANPDAIPDKDIALYDFERRPGPRPDRDAAFVEMIDTERNTPESVHQRAEEMAALYLRDERVRELLGNTSTAAIVVEDKDNFNKLVEASQRDAEAAAQATLAAAAGTPSPDPAAPQAPESQTGATGSATSSAIGTNSTAASGDGKASRPSEVEATLAQIQLTGARQDRFVIVGDSNIRQAFYDALAERGKLTYAGGVPVINVSQKAAQKILEEVASRTPGASVQHAVNLEVDRTGHGLLGGIAASIKNNLWQKHEVNVFAVGSPEVIDKQLKDIGTLLTKMDDAKFFRASEGAAEATGGEADKRSAVAAHVTPGENKLVLSESEPLRLKGAVGLDEVIGLPKAAVADFRREQEAADTVRKEFRNAREDKARLAEQGPMDATTTTSSEQPVVVNGLALRLSAELKAAVESPADLNTADKTGKHPAGVGLVLQSGVFKDPALAEISTLPTESRQRMLTHLAALTTKMADGDFGDNGKEALKHVRRGDGMEPDLRTLSEKVQQWVAAEVARDPQFTENAKSHLDAMVSSGVLTAEQADRALPQERQADAVADAKVTSAEPQQATPTAEATATTPTADAAAPEAKSEMPKVAEDVVHASAEASAAVTSKDTAAAPAVEQAPVAPEPARSAEPESLSDKLALLAKEGSAAMSPSAVSDVLAELDARRTQPLSALDSGTGASPTKTLENLDVVLQAASKGEHGKENVATAKDLDAALRDWKAQDQVRVGAPAAPTQEAVQSVPAASVQTAEASTTAKESSAAVTTTNTPASTPTVTPEATRAATEANIQTLTSMMANPAGSFTKRDGSWDTASVQKAAQAVTALDVPTVTTMASLTQARVTAYSVWVADNATNHKLPGFSSPEGRQQAEAVTAKAMDLLNQASFKQMPEEATRNIARADRFVDAMAATELASTKAAATTATAAENSSGRVSAVDPTGLAKDMVHAVYQAPSISEAYVKYLLKNAPALTPEAIGSLDKDTQAKTLVALSELTSMVRSGQMGDFDTLSSAVKGFTHKAQGVADKLQDAFSKDAGMNIPQIKAYNELDARNNSPSAAKEKSQEPQQESSSAAPKATERAIDNGRER